jgi:sugar phosphate permease
MMNLRPDLDTARPTRVRCLIVGVATLMAVVLYLHRICLSFVERYIKDDLGLSNEQIGVVLSAFFWAYALGQVPGGWLGDRFGVRWVLALYIGLWSLFTGLMGAATGFAVVLALRLGCGLAQAGAYPTSASLLSKWVPFAARGFASAVVSVGGRLGGTLAPVLTAYLLVAFVPPDVSALLEPGDVLDVRGLCRRLAEGGPTPADSLGRRILDGLPPDAAEAVRTVAGQPAGAVPEAERMTSLVLGLNEALRRPELCREEDLRDLPLPREALSLGAAPREELSAAQVERLNRLAFEAAFPEHVRKLYGQGWRPVMAVYGVLGLLVAVLFWVVFRERPGQHPWCNAAEAALVGAGPGGAAPARATGLPILALVRSRSLGLSSFSQFTTNFGWVFLITWLPRYLAEVHHVPVVARGWMASVPLGVGMLGMLAGGWVTDALTRAVGLRWGRCLPMALTRFGAMSAFLACTLLDSPWQATVAFAVVALATDLGTASVWAFMQDVGGRYIGSILGWGNMWGNVGAAVSPLVLNWVVADLGWDAAFLTCAGSFLLSGVAALGVDARIPIVHEDATPAPRQ